MKTVIMFSNETSKVCLTAVGQSTTVNIQNRGILMNTTWPTEFRNWTSDSRQITNYFQKHLHSVLVEKIETAESSKGNTTGMTNGRKIL
ncbi:hypothetical protein MTR_4g064140 [Medicago truncatula]|uniref:Uncharacterized protein n=1 Tax=Medicago truncatula TaxID=3880 RepID=G7JUT5_MEDTR|nr:hypothetical protein MTR_4g064140 [Medicago truncatula]